MTPYTPPEPAVPASDMIQNVDGLMGELFTLAQLRSEVERVRRETVEECANAVHEIPRNGAWVTKVEAIAAIEGLLK